MNQHPLIQKIVDLAAIPSTADNPLSLAQAHDYMLEFVHEATNGQITIERFSQNGKPSFLAYRGALRPNNFDVLLNAHLDVVRGAPELFEPFIAGGNLYGRGVLDMKGTAIVLTSVFSELVNRVPYNLGLQIVTDEEVGGYDCARLQIENGLRASFVIVGEYSNEPHTIYNAARGLCWAEIAFSGKGAHGGHLWHGSNAIMKASDFAQAVLKKYPIPKEESWTTTANIASLTTQNTTFNLVPDQATLKIDFRFTEEDAIFKDRASFEAFVATIDPGAEVKELSLFEPALKVDPAHPKVQKMAEAIKATTGQNTQFRSRPAGSDGRHFAAIHSDVIEMGLRGANQHADNEYIEVASIPEYQAILRHFLINMLPVPVHTQAKLSHVKQ